MKPQMLTDMLTDLRHEARLSADFAHGSHLEAQHIALLRRVQEELYDAHDWPMLVGTATTAVPAGQRYTAYPAKTEFSGILRVWARNTGDERWHPLEYGITAEELNTFDSDADERSETVRRWQHYVADAEPVATNMFELWPLPKKALTVRFERKRALDPLVDKNADYSTLDGPSIVLHAAAEILAAEKAEDASLKLQKAVDRVNMVRKVQAKSGTIRHGMAAPKVRRGPQWPTS